MKFDELEAFMKKRLLAYTNVLSDNTKSTFPNSDSYMIQECAYESSQIFLADVFTKHMKFVEETIRVHLIQNKLEPEKFSFDELIGEILSTIEEGPDELEAVKSDMLHSYSEKVRASSDEVNRLNSKRKSYLKEIIELDTSIKKASERYELDKSLHDEIKKALTNGSSKSSSVKEL